MVGTRLHAAAAGASTAAGETADDDVEEGDDAVDDGGAHGADGVDNGHDDIADGAEDGLDLLGSVSIARTCGRARDRGVAYARDNGAHGVGCVGYLLFWLWLFVGVLVGGVPSCARPLWSGLVVGCCFSEALRHAGKVSADKCIAPSL